METDLLKIFQIEPDAYELAYLFGIDQGRRFTRGALLKRPILVSELEKHAIENKLSTGDLIKKRNIMLDAIVEFLEEYYQPRLGVS